MNKVFICPYFGKLPKNFQLFLDSCIINKSYTWIILTDDKTEYLVPKNVEIKYMQFGELKQKIQSCFDFKVSLDTPYKLCDYKPIYGYIFEDMIKEYEFWGHCDLDMMLGDLNNFIDDEILLSFDKILFLGHMSLYRNKKEINGVFKTPMNGMSYKEIISSNKNYAFDEINNGCNINDIIEKKGFSIYKKNIYADISCMHYNFRVINYNSSYKRSLEKKKKQIFLWSEGKLTRHYLNDDKIEQEEFAYIHFQKRKINIDKEVDSNKKVLILPDRVLKIENEITKDLIRKNSKLKILYKMYFIQKYKALLWHYKNIKGKFFSFLNQVNFH